MGRILLVDDHPEFLASLETSMKNAGFIIDTAKDGFEAMAKIKASKGIDCILADYDMPGLKGAELAAGIKYDTNIPIIMMTCTPDFSFEKLYKAGISGVMTKPFDADTFIEFLKNNDLHLADRIINQRKFLRKDLPKEPLTIEISNGMESVKAQLINLSAGGLGVFFHKKDMRISTVQFKMSHLNETLEGFMHCRWKGVDEDMVKAGFEFDSITKSLISTSAIFKKLLLI